MITTSFHPHYRTSEYEYEKWRLTYEGGQAFIAKYLKKFDAREDDNDFKERKEMAYCPAFAKEGIVAIKNGIYQRMSEISRKGGSQSYKDAISGKDGGVDLQGSSMNTFIGQQVLPELLVMGKVGVYVDMPAFAPVSTLAQFARAPRPYLYPYRAEDIVNWSWITFDNELYFTHLLLREKKFIFDEATGLPTGEADVYRFLRLTQEGVLVQFWDQISNKGKIEERLISETTLNIKRIPFVLLDLGNSLLRDIADYQIGLLNLASSDLNYSLKANFPFYTEPYDPKTEALFQNKGPVSTTDTTTNTATEKSGKSNAGSQEIEVGTTRGRRYPIGGERPSFIHPSPEPLVASMKKQEQMRDEIRALLNLAASNVAPSRASAESKKVDQIGLESGLAAIGLELEGGERDIATIWEGYFERKNFPATIVYPTTYSLKTDDQRLAEATKQKELKVAVPSKTFQKYMSSEIADTLFEGKIPADELDKVHKEIKDANYITSDPDEIQKDIEMGLVTAVTASNARGYNGETEVPKAQEEHTQRLAAIAISQTKALGAARGVNTGPGDNTAQQEKTLSQKTPDLQPNPADPKTRGTAK